MLAMSEEDLLKRDISRLLQAHGEEAAAAPRVVPAARAARKRPRDEARRAARMAASGGPGARGGVSAVVAAVPKGYNKQGPFFPSASRPAEAELVAAVAPSGSRGAKGVAAAPVSAAAAAQLAAVLQLDAIGLTRMDGKLGSGDGHWYENSTLDPAEATAGNSVSVAVAAVRLGVDSVLMAQLRMLAERLLAEEVTCHDSRAAGSADGSSGWMRTALETGTGADRLASRALLVARSPLHALKHLDALLQVSRVKSRRESSAASAAVKDLLLTNLLPAARKLVPFESRACEVATIVAASRSNGKADTTTTAAAAALTAERLVWWAWEDALKTRVSTFLAALGSHLADGIVHFKVAALHTVFDLLVARPEGEDVLLDLLVHKLGDPEGSIASKAQRLMLKLVAPGQHEAMRPVLVRALQQFLHKAQLTPSARYFTVATLNQVPLERGQVALAGDLVETYLSLFESTTRAGALESKLLSALLTGINRALPYASASPAAQADVEMRADAIFTVAAGASTSTAIQALILLQTLAQRHIERDRELAAAGVVAAAGEGTNGGAFVSRFYSTLYGKLDPISIAATNKHALLLNTVFRALKADPSVPRARAMLKKLVQVALHLPPAFAAGTIVLVAEAVRSRSELREAVSRPQDAGLVSAEIAAAAMAQSVDTVRRRALQRLDTALLDIGAAAAPAPAAALPLALPTKLPPRPYNPYAADPAKAGAEGTYLWELTPLAQHYHPGVRALADRFLAAPGTALDYAGDPLADFTLMAFLDRFAYKNPKKKAVAAFGSSGDKIDAGLVSRAAAGGDELARAMEEGYAVVQGRQLEAAAAAGDNVSKLVHGSSLMQRVGSRHGRVDVEAPATSKAFAEKSTASVRGEDRFLHIFFQKKAEAAKLSEPLEEVDEDAEEEAFAQKLAEGLMEDADVDEESDFSEGDDAGSDEDEGEGGEEDGDEDALS